MPPSRLAPLLADGTLPDGWRVTPLFGKLPRTMRVDCHDKLIPSHHIPMSRSLCAWLFELAAAAAAQPDTAADFFACGVC